MPLYLIFGRYILFGRFSRHLVDSRRYILFSRFNRYLVDFSRYILFLVDILHHMCYI